VSGAAVAVAVSVVVWTAGEMVFSPVASAYVAALAPPTLRGRYTATWGLMFALGAVLGPAAGTALYAWHPRALWLACLVVGVVSALLLVRARARPVELEPLPA
jgi:MFS family permease